MKNKFSKIKKIRILIKNNEEYIEELRICNMNYYTSIIYFYKTGLQYNNVNYSKIDEIHSNINRNLYHIEEICFKNSIYINDIIKIKNKIHSIRDTQRKWNIRKEKRKLKSSCYNNNNSHWLPECTDFITQRNLADPDIINRNRQELGYKIKVNLENKKISRL